MQPRYFQTVGLAVFLVCALLLILPGCGEKQAASEGDDTGSKALAQPSIDNNQAVFPDSTVVVRVNDSPITMREVDYAMQRIGQKKPDEQDPEKLTETAIESLIDSRLIALEAESQLGEQARALVDFQTAAYREQLLVKAYLKANAGASSVSDEAVQSYYVEHPEEFGSIREMRFEVIETTRELEAQELLDIKPLLQSLRELSGWREWLAEHSELPLGYRQQSVNLDLLDEGLKAYMGNAMPGEVNIIDNGKQLQLIRILDRKERPPKAFSAVSGEISRKLASIANREKLNKRIRELRRKATIRYSDPQKQ